MGKIKVGMKKRGYEIGIKDGHKYTLVICPKCGKERWIQERLLSRLTRLCRKCSNVTSGLERRGHIIGAKHSSWKGGRKISYGYVLIWLDPSDFFYPMTHSPTSTNGGGAYVGEHRLVMAKHLKRCLLPWEVVHHKNGIKDDNRIENLELLPAPYKHTAVTLLVNYIHKLEKENQELKTELRKFRDV